MPLLAAASQSAGESLWMLRILPALFHVGAVLAACAIVRLLGGGRGAQIVTGLATGTAPLLLGVTATLGTTAIEPLSWTLVAYAALRAVRNGETGWWIAAGTVAGISLETKYTIAFFLVALVAGLLVAGPRATFARQLFWAGTAVTIALAAPSLLWQAANGWPMLDVLRAGAGGKTWCWRRRHGWSTKCWSSARRSRRFGLRGSCGWPCARANGSPALPCACCSRYS